MRAFVENGLYLDLPHEALAAFKNLFDQFGFRRFHIAAQHAFGTRSAKQYHGSAPLPYLGASR